MESKRLWLPSIPQIIVFYAGWTKLEPFPFTLRMGRLFAILRCRRVWKFPLPMPESFMNREDIKEKLEQIVEGNGDLPLYIASNMKQESSVLSNVSRIGYERLRTSL